jgi:hypothetical protein
MKEQGTSTKHPTIRISHIDIEGSKTVSFWIPVDAVDEDDLFATAFHHITVHGASGVATHTHVDQFNHCLGMPLPK